MSGGLPIDLILFAMVAAFLVLRLRSVLGRRTGFERQPGEAAPGAAQPVPAREADLPPPAPAGRAASQGCSAGPPAYTSAGGGSTSTTEVPTTVRAWWRSVTWK